MELYLNAEGDVVSWDELTDVEQKYYSPSGQELVAEWGLTIREYVDKMEIEEYWTVAHDGH